MMNALSKFIIVLTGACVLSNAYCFGVGMSSMSGCTSCIPHWMSSRRNNMGCMPLCPMQQPVIHQ